MGRVLSRFDCNCHRISCAKKSYPLIFTIFFVIKLKSSKEEKNMQEENFQEEDNAKRMGEVMAVAWIRIYALFFFSFFFLGRKGRNGDKREKCVAVCGSRGISCVLGENISKRKTPLKT